MRVTRKGVSSQRSQRETYIWSGEFSGSPKGDARLKLSEGDSGFSSGKTSAISSVGRAADS